MAYTGFDALAKKVGSKALAAWIGRRLYGKTKFQHAAATGTSLRNVQKMPAFRGKPGK